jgi:predicted peptidase
VRLILISIILTGLFLIHRPAVHAQVDPEVDARLEKRWHPYQDSTLPYRLFVPDAYTSSRTYPLILFLHGAMWCGSDNVTQLDNELAIFWVQEAVQSIQPCFVVFPQCPTGQTWEVVTGQVDHFPPAPMLEAVMDLLDSLAREFSINADKVSCVGKSIGGLGVYGLLSRYPDRFAAIMPVAGMTVYQDVSLISHVPIWILHAKGDLSVPIAISEQMVQLLEDEGEPFVYTHCNEFLEQCEPISEDSMDQVIASGESHILSIFDTTTHQIEPKVVKTCGLAEWLLSQQKNQTGVQSGESRHDLLFCSNYPNPFNPRTTIQYEIADKARVCVVIFDATGRIVRHILSGDQGPGIHTIEWNGRNDEGEPLSSGLYLCQIQINRLYYIHKLLLSR